MQRLEEWLRVATRGLCPDAVTRVRAEIADHHKSTFESAVAAGVDAAEAERRAVAALGDARTANRQYRRVLLTIWQDLLFSNMLSPPTHLAGFSTNQVRVGRLLATILLLEAVAGLLGISLLQQSWPYVTALAAMVVAVALQELIARTVRVRSIRVGWMIRLLRWGALATAALFSVAIGQPAVGIGFLLGFGPIEYTRFVLRRKIPISQWPARLYH
jgi:hypothetical protein